MSNGTEEKVVCPRCEVSPSKYLPGTDDIEVCHNCRERIKECVSYVAVGDCCWGRGKDVTTAKKQCVIASGSRHKFRGGRLPDSRRRQAFGGRVRQHLLLREVGSH